MSHVIKIELRIFFYMLFYIGYRNSKINYNTTISIIYIIKDNRREKNVHMTNY